MAPSGHLIPQHQCSGIINEQRIFQPYALDKVYMPCNTGKTYRNCQESFTLSGEPFIFTSPTIKDPSNTKKQTFPKESVLYISGPKTLTAATNYPAVMHIPEGSNIRYIGSKNNETIFIINNSMSGTLKGGAGKENTIVMNVKANNNAANLHSGTIFIFILLYIYITIFIANEDSDNARIVSDLGSAGKIKENIDVIRIQVANITEWEISEDKVGYSLDLLANNSQSIVSSTKIDDFENLIIQVYCSGVTESVAIQDKSLFDMAEDFRYQKLKNSGNDVSGEVIQDSEKKLKAFIQASILGQVLPCTYQVAKDIASKSNLDIPLSQIEITEVRIIEEAMIMLTI